MKVFVAYSYEAELDPPFNNHTDLHATIDFIPHDDAPWQCLVAKYNEPLPADNIPTWMTQEYQIWCCDIRTVARVILNNPNFKEEFHTAPYYKYTNTGKC